MIRPNILTTLQSSLYQQNLKPWFTSQLAQREILRRTSCRGTAGTFQRCRRTASGIADRRTCLHWRWPMERHPHLLPGHGLPGPASWAVLPSACPVALSRRTSQPNRTPGCKEVTHKTAGDVKTALFHNHVTFSVNESWQTELKVKTLYFDPVSGTENFKLLTVYETLLIKVV